MTKVDFELGYIMSIRLVLTHWLMRWREVCGLLSAKYLKPLLVIGWMDIAMFQKLDLFPSLHSKVWKHQFCRMLHLGKLKKMDNVRTISHVCNTPLLEAFRLRTKFTIPSLCSSDA